MFARFREQTSQLLRDKATQRLQAQSETATTETTTTTTTTTTSTTDNGDLSESSDVISMADAPPREEESISDECVDESERTNDESIISAAASTTSRTTRSWIGTIQNNNSEDYHDPEVMHSMQEIRIIQKELQRIRLQSKSTKVRRRQELNKSKSHKNQKARELWITQQSHKRFFYGIASYKESAMKCSLPCHDISNATLNAEAKLLKAQHASQIMSHQLQILNAHQQGLIDYLYTSCLPDIKQEQELARMVGQSQVDKLASSRDHMVDVFEHCMGLQRKIIAKYRLRELEHVNTSHSQNSSPAKGPAPSNTGNTGAVSSTELELLHVFAGETPAMERVPALRDSAKRRLDERKALQDKRDERRKERDSQLKESKQQVEHMEQRYKSTLSNDSVALSCASVSGDEDIVSLSSGASGTSHTHTNNAAEFGHNQEHDDVNKETTNTTATNTTSSSFGNSFDNNEFDGSREAWKNQQDLPDEEDNNNNNNDNDNNDASRTSVKLMNTSENTKKKEKEHPNDHSFDMTTLLEGEGNDDGMVTRLDTSNNSIRSGGSRRSRSPIRRPRSPKDATSASRQQLAPKPDTSHSSSMEEETAGSEGKKNDGDNDKQVEAGQDKSDENNEGDKRDGDSSVSVLSDEGEGRTLSAAQQRAARTRGNSSKTSSISSSSRASGSTASAGIGQRRKGCLPTSRVNAGGRGARSNLLERARSARLNTGVGTGAVTGAAAVVGSSSARAARTSAISTRPSIGSRAMSSRDFISTRRPGRPTATNLSRSDNNNHTAGASTTRPSVSASGDREARMERLASRRTLTGGASSRRLNSRASTTNAASTSTGAT